jgi:hypothetical protein
MVSITPLAGCRQLLFFAEEIVSFDPYLPGGGLPCPKQTPKLYENKSKK